LINRNTVKRRLRCTRTRSRSLAGATWAWLGLGLPRQMWRWNTILVRVTVAYCTYCRQYMLYYRIIWTTQWWQSKATIVVVTVAERKQQAAVHHKQANICWIFKRNVLFGERKNSENFYKLSIWMLFQNFLNLAILFDWFFYNYFSGQERRARATRKQKRQTKTHWSARPPVRNILYFDYNILFSKLFFKTSLW